MRIVCECIGSRIEIRKRYYIDDMFAHRCGAQSLWHLFSHM